MSTLAWIVAAALVVGPLLAIGFSLAGAAGDRGRVVVNTAALHPGAVVECDVRGLVFEAPVTGRPAAGLVDVDPPAGITYRRLRACQVRRVLSPAPADPRQHTFDITNTDSADGAREENSTS